MNDLPLGPFEVRSIANDHSTTAGRTVMPIEKGLRAALDLGRTFTARVEERLAEGVFRLRTTAGALDVQARVPLLAGRSYLFERLGEGAAERLRVLAPVSDTAEARVGEPRFDLGRVLSRWFSETARTPSDVEVESHLATGSPSAWREALARYVDVPVEAWILRWVLGKRSAGHGSPFHDALLELVQRELAIRSTSDGGDPVQTWQHVWHEYRTARDDVRSQRVLDGAPWYFEIPFLDGEHIDHADLFVFDDGESGRGPSLQRSQRVLLHLTLTATGPLEVDVSTPADGSVSITIVACEAWVARFERELPTLQGALAAAGFQESNLCVTPRDRLAPDRPDGRLLDVLL